ncbi:Uncharacterised protein [Chlamydia trachomatis]|nr:Uncharacterised protein [Chlamydia trachomatis]
MKNRSQRPRKSNVVKKLNADCVVALTLMRIRLRPLGPAIRMAPGRSDLASSLTKLGGAEGGFVVRPTSGGIGRVSRQLTIIDRLKP